MCRLKYRLMTKLSANWPFLLTSQVLKGKFFLRPELAMGMGTQVAAILNGNGGQHGRENRRMEISAFNENGKIRSFLFDDEDDEEDDEDHSPYDGIPEGSVARIPVKGTMLKYGTWCEYGMQEIGAFVMEAAAHKNISAIVLDYDSGGGAVDAVAPINHAVSFAKSLGKPVVASIDMACSAAYWSASTTDYIVADNDISAEVGSIGVMMSFMDVKGYYEKEGIKLHTIYASESGEKNLAFQKALDGEYDLIREEELDPLARSFQSAVRENRSGKINLSAKGILNGKTYYAEQAKENGLIDRIGNNTTAVEIALAMAHARKININ